MTRREQLKEKIKSALFSAERRIAVPYHDAVGLFGEVVAENPAIAACIDGAEFTEGERGGTFSVTYLDIMFADKRVTAVRDADELEDVLHATISSIDDEKTVLVPSSVNVHDFYHNFLTVYNGYYSNLTDMTCIIIGRNGLFSRVRFTFTYRIGKVKLQMMERAVEDKIARLNSALYLPDMQPETKALIAHNYLRYNVSYWKKDEPNELERSYMQSAYGALINGRCVCQGYAEAYKRMMTSQGIICEVVVGKVRGSSTGHAWNIISFDGVNFSHVDVTWDDSSDSYKYYGVSDAVMNKDRLWRRAPNMICNGKADILQEAKNQISLNKARYIKSGINKKYLSF